METNTRCGWRSPKIAPFRNEVCLFRGSTGRPFSRHGPAEVLDLGRPSSEHVERPDRIFVFERGRLVEVGKYRELIDADGPFSQLAWRQIL
jgi:hypothetical protein